MSVKKPKKSKRPKKRQRSKARKSKRRKPTPWHERIRRTKSWKAWRKKVYTRDQYTCQMCGKKNCYLEPHHIIPKSQKREWVFKVDNGIALCKDCHSKTPGIHDPDPLLVKKLRIKVSENTRRQRCRKPHPSTM